MALRTLVTVVTVAEPHSGPWFSTQPDTGWRGAIHYRGQFSIQARSVPWYSSLLLTHRSDCSVCVPAGSRRSRSSDSDPVVVGGWDLAQGRWVELQRTIPAATVAELDLSTGGRGSGS